MSADKFLLAGPYPDTSQICTNKCMRIDADLDRPKVMSSGFAASWHLQLLKEL